MHPFSPGHWEVSYRILTVALMSLRRPAPDYKGLWANIRVNISFTKATTSSLLLHPEAITDIYQVWLKELMIYLPPFSHTIMENIYHS